MSDPDGDEENAGTPGDAADAAARASSDAAGATDEAPTDEAPASGATEGTFLVTAVDDATAVLRDVERGQVHTVAEPPEDLAVGEAVVGRIEPVPPMDVRWRLATVEERFQIAVAESDEPPTAHERDLAPESVGDLVRRARAGEGELHVLRVPEDDTDAAVADVLADETGLRERAARLGVARVDVRSAPGVVCVRYLP